MSSCAALTAKQAKFVANFLAVPNGTRAAVAAGYGKAGAHVTASRLLRNPKVQKALQARQTADATRLCLRREDALQGLLEAVEQARMIGDPATLISAWREIGRMLGFYEPEVRRIAFDRSDDELRRFELMTDAELASLAAVGTAG